MSKGIIVNKNTFSKFITENYINKNYCPSENKSWLSNGGLCSSKNSKKDCLNCWIEEFKLGLKD